MRETLYQVGVTLALPIAVGAVWIARAEQAKPSVRERATAYRVELAELPLPIRDQLRPPGFATGVPVARQAPEDAAPGRQRPALAVPSQLAPAPVEIAAQVDAKLALAAAFSPGAVPETTGALPALPWAGLRAAAPIALGAGSLSSRRAAAPASAAPSTASERPAPSSAGKPVADRPASDADLVHVPGAGPARGAVPDQVVEKLPPVASNPVHVPGAGPARGAVPDQVVEKLPPVASNPVHVPGPGPARDTVPDQVVEKLPPVASNPVHVPGPGPALAAVPDRIIDELPPIARAPVGFDPGRPERLAPPRDNRPLVPSGPIESWFDDFSLPTGSPMPSFQPLDLPRFEPETPKTATPIALVPEVSVAPPVLQWTSLRPMLVLIPEPGSALLLGASLAALGALRRSRRRV